ncbi:hypothetical protein FOA52_010277 [Chlamydomonas sp. UWO 241]|nr:hypothetical protein FOA52_010277 [Chlamydomonas sp. UWO 241]
MNAWACSSSQRTALPVRSCCTPVCSTSVRSTTPGRCQALPRGELQLYDDDGESFMEMTTVLTSDGRMVRIPGKTVGKPARRPFAPMPTWDEQKLCIGASFVLAATNGHNPSRRINMEGFCQSVDYLFESIEGSVRARRGEILMEERQLKSGMHETLHLIIAVPQLFGVPQCPLQLLSDAIETGGGVVHRMYHQWHIY